jgi:hypothetical protein
MLVGALLAAALVAVVQTQRPPARHVASEPTQEERPFAPLNDELQDGVLPPNHPPIGASDPHQGVFGQGQGEETMQSIVWTVPSNWRSVPNPNGMRLATYHVPAAAGAADEAELSVVRAGGSPEANIERWVGQFADRGSDKRAQRKVNGLMISTLEISGTFNAGGMTTSDAPANPRKGWMLAGAVVETDEGLYFFKLTGPSASIKAARRDFDALLASISPAPESP